MSRAVPTGDPADRANYPNFGHRVLLEPPADVATAEERLARADEVDYECLDWWFYLEEAT